MNPALAVSLLAFGLTVYAVPPPALAVLPPDTWPGDEFANQQLIDRSRELATEVVDLRIDKTSRHGSLFTLEASVIDVIRTCHGIRAGDSISIEFRDATAANRRFNEELERNPKPGPGFRPVMYLPEEGDRLRANLITQPGVKNRFTISGGIGAFMHLPRADPCDGNAK
jgi:hypothetical protein